MDPFSATGRIPQLAGMIEEDVRRRGLAVGDNYLTAEEVGRQFQIHPRSASRAMHLLAERGVLVRRRGAGTFIGPNARPGAAVAVRCVHLLVTQQRVRVGLPVGDLIEGLLETCGSGNVQFDMLPEQSPLDHVREVLAGGRAAGTLSGLVLVGCGREIQEAVVHSGVPTVVFGGVYPSTYALVSVDLDQFELGYQLARHLLRRGRQRLALITRENWLPGDNAYHDGILKAREESAEPRGGVMIRALAPTDPEMTAREIGRALTRPDCPDGLICRGPFFAGAAMQAAASAGLKLLRDLEIVFDHWAYHREIRLPHAYPLLSYKEQAEVVGKLLKDLIEGRRPDPEHRLLPVHGVRSGGHGRQLHSTIKSYRQ
jgi:DNA-binding LacI/PurR family transcriptional regulator